MAWLLRKSAAPIAVYSIALQALLWGFLPANHFGFDPFAIICSADSSEGQQHSPPRHRSNCDACLPACGSSLLSCPRALRSRRYSLPTDPNIRPYWPKRRHYKRTISCKNRVRPHRL